MTGVPAAGLPKMMTLVLRSSSPLFAASPLWSMTAKSVSPCSANSRTQCATVSSTEPAATFVTNFAAVGRRRIKHSRVLPRFVPASTAHNPWNC